MKEQAIQLHTTADGSFTFFNDKVGEHYHSVHGALQESLHVFIDAGLKKGISEASTSTIRILEIGFGTGLNFLLSSDYCCQHQVQLYYTAIEPFALSVHQLAATNYVQHLQHPAIWRNLLTQYPLLLQKEEYQSIEKNIFLRIAPTKLQEYSSAELVDVLYYDAFSARHQSEMWTAETIIHACNFLKPGGVFVTYSITGDLKRILKNLGFVIEKLPGAARKREMLRATKEK